MIHAFVKYQKLGTGIMNLKMKERHREEDSKDDVLDAPVPLVSVGFNANASSSSLPFPLLSPLLSPAGD